MALYSASYDKLITLFKEAYKMNFKAAGVSVLNYDDCIKIIKTIFAGNPHIANQQLITDDQLFKDLYFQIIDYKAKKQTLPDNPINNDLFYIDMHGSFNFTKGFQKIPPNIVLVFLTPVNRLGICGTLSDNEVINDTFENPILRNNILNNILCIDKINKNKRKNNRLFINEFAFFENSIVLLPGQYYYDLDLFMSVADKNKYLMNISYYGAKNIENIIPEFELEYKNTLSEIINNIVLPQTSSNTDSDQISYIIVNCCRSLNYVNENGTSIYGKDGTDIYVYENFMFYFNTIMFNCNENIISENLPLLKFHKVNVMAVMENITTFNKVKLAVEHSLALYLNNDNTIIKTIIDLINITDLKVRHVNNFLNTIKLKYDTDAAAFYPIKIDVKIIYEFIFNLYNINNINKLNNSKYDSAINELINLYEAINLIFKALNKRSSDFHLFNKHKEMRKKTILMLKTNINKMLEIEVVKTALKQFETKELKLLNLIELQEFLNKSLDDIDNIDDYDVCEELKHILGQFIIDPNEMQQKLINFIIREKYHGLIDALFNLLNNKFYKFITPTNNEFIKQIKIDNKLASIKRKSSSALGHIGRSALATSLLYLKSQLIQPIEASDADVKSVLLAKHTKKLFANKKKNFSKLTAKNIIHTTLNKPKNITPLTQNNINKHKFTFEHNARFRVHVPVINNRPIINSQNNEKAFLKAFEALTITNKHANTATHTTA